MSLAPVETAGTLEGNKEKIFELPALEGDRGDGCGDQRSELSSPAALRSGRCIGLAMDETVPSAMDGTASGSEMSGGGRDAGRALSESQGVKGSSGLGEKREEEGSGKELFNSSSSSSSPWPGSAPSCSRMVEKKLLLGIPADSKMETFKIS